VGVGGGDPTIHDEGEAESWGGCQFGEWVRWYDRAASKRCYGAVACGGGEGRSVLTAEPIAIIPEVKQENVFFVVTAVTSERAEVVMDRGQGGEGRGLVRVVLGFTPNEVVDRDCFV
jgi:hypothetical protein